MLLVSNISFGERKRTGQQRLVRMFHKRNREKKSINIVTYCKPNINLMRECKIVGKKTKKTQTHPKKQAKTNKERKKSVTPKPCFLCCFGQNGGDI